MKNKSWIYKVFFLSFILSIIFSTITNIVAYHTNIPIIIIIMLLVISIGILFDMVGTSVLSCNISSIHAMCSQKVKGAKETITLIKNKDKVANLCNDVIGDVCGIVSGSLGAVLALSISNNVFVSIIIAALISSLTVGGKALFKTIAIKHADHIIFFVGKIKHTFKIN